MELLTFVVVAIWIVVASGGLPPVIRIGKFLIVYKQTKNALMKKGVSYPYQLWNSSSNLPFFKCGLFQKIIDPIFKY